MRRKRVAATPGKRRKFLERRRRKMQLVYATGQREREFRIAGGREEVPAGARVYATCTTESAVENVGEATFQTMTDAEYYELKAQVREARRRAAAQSVAALAPEASPLRQLIGKLFSR
jgi:hypothetical protein